MKRLTLSISIALISFSANAASGPYRIETSSKDEKGSSIQTVIGEAHFLSAPQEVWTLLRRFEDFPKYIPRVSSCESLGIKSNTEQVYFEFKLPFPFHRLWNVVALTSEEKDKKFEWRMLQGNMSVNTGKLEVLPEQKGSRLRMEVQADPGLFLPNWLVAWSAKHFLPKILSAIGDRLNKGSLAPH